MTRAFATSIDAVYSGAQVRAFDAFAIDRLGLSGFTLMTRAATAALQALRTRWSVARELVVVCGGGLNGGDGYVLARLARQQGCRVRVIALVEPAHLRAEAARAWREAEVDGVTILPMPPSTASLDAALATADVIVDALLGIGLQRELGGAFATMVEAINRSARPVMALDLPSGLCAESGAVRGAAVRADLTVTFIAAKAGLFFGQGREYAGEVVLATLDIPPEALPNAIPVARLLTPRQLRQRISPRRYDTHKGEAGHVLVVGGGEGMPGAARLAGLAALRAGAGRVTVLAAPSSVSAIAAGVAELMVRALEGSESAVLATLGQVARAQAIVLGPGLGGDGWSRAVYATVRAFAEREGLPLVIDADALTLLADSINSLPASGSTIRAVTPNSSATLTVATTVITPHPGEAARLLGVDSAATVQRDRLGALASLVQRIAAVVVLKGAGTLVGASGSIPTLCLRGHPVMAAPGTGDVLAGIVGALLAQGGDARGAAELGVLWHALAGERVAAGVDRGRLASELAACLPEVLGEYLPGDRS